MLERIIKVNKKAITDLLSYRPIKTDRTELKIMDNKDIEYFINHCIVSNSLADDSEFAALFKEKCRNELETDTAITLAIHLSTSKEYIGYFEIKHMDSTPEIGIDIIETEQRNGIGYEVCLGVINYLFNNTEIKALRYNCFRNNSASIALAKKLGAVYIGEKVLLEHIKSTDVSEALKSEAASFDLLMYEIIKHDKNCPTNKREYPLN